MAEEEFWAGEMGRTWAARADALDRQLAPAGELGLAALAPRPGERILDLGCGAGASTAAIAGSVAPDGGVTGVDISGDVLAIARARPENAGVAFIEGDAARLPLGEAVFDAMFSRFGCMFFADPPAAYAHLRAALKPGARIVLVAWREIAMNPWAAVPVAVGAEALGPVEPQAPGTAGPFAWADPEIFRPVLESAGFSGVTWREERITLRIGEDGEGDPVSRAVALLTHVGPLARRLRDQPEATRDAVAERLAPALAPFVRDGWVRMPGAIWVIRARA